MQLRMDSGIRKTQSGNSGWGGEGVARQIVAQLASWLQALGRRVRLTIAPQGVGTRRQMKLVESLALGNRRQLLLVACGNQRYLVGAGAETVGSILPIASETILRDEAAKGPKLVRRSGRERRGTASATAPDLGLWQ